MSEISLKDLLEAGVHFGHQVKRWSPKMEQYIYTARDDIHVIDLTKTKACLLNACAFVESVAATGAPIIFVGTKKQAQAIVQEEAERAGVHYIATRWVGGLVTNWEEIKKTLSRMEKHETEKESGSLSKFTKKENMLMEREMSRRSRIFGGIRGLTQLPALIFVVDVKTEMNAVLEGRKRGIPIVAICDTNSDPTLVDYPIPGNDDAVKAIRLITSKIADAVLAGRALAEKEAPPLVEDKVPKEERKKPKKRITQEVTTRKTQAKKTTKAKKA